MKQPQHKILNFMRRNAVYFILSLCIIAVGLSITFMLLNRDNQIADNQGSNPTINQPLPDDPSDSTGGGEVINPDDKPVDNPDDNTEPVAKPIEFIIPVSSVTSIGEYSETMVWSSTLGRFSAHMAVDFFAEEGTDVLAVYDGTVESIENTLLKGTTIVLDHGNGLKTVYNSILDGDDVYVGQILKKGDKIGEVSTSNRQEAKSGAHLHFEVIENGVSIDPVKYLVIDEK